MKKNGLLSKIAAMTLVAIMCCCMAASAFGAYDSRTTTLYGSNNVRYDACSTLFVDGGNEYRAGGRIMTQDGSKVGARTMSYMATLIEASSGDVIVSRTSENSSSTNFLEATPTNSYRTSNNVASLGWAKIDSLPYYMRLGETNSSAGLRSVEMQSQLSMLAENTLTEDCSYPVNTAGETYGSILLADMVGEDPNLIAAVNQDGVRGYIRVSDFPMPGQAIPVSEIQTIPLYNMDGHMIGSFGLETSENVAIDAPQF